MVLAFVVDPGGLRRSGAAPERCMCEAGARRGAHVLAARQTKFSEAGRAVVRRNRRSLRKRRKCVRFGFDDREGCDVVGRTYSENVLRTAPAQSKAPASIGFVEKLVRTAVVGLVSAVVSFSSLDMQSAQGDVVHGAESVSNRERTPAEMSIRLNRAVTLEVLQDVQMFYYDPLGGLNYDDESWQSLSHRLLATHDLDSNVFSSAVHTHELLNTILSTLHDPYSALIPSASLHSQTNPQIQPNPPVRPNSIGMSPNLSGVGLQLASLSDSVDSQQAGFRVVAPLPESPAEFGGILAGDVVLAVDDVDFREYSGHDTSSIHKKITLDEAVALLRGPPGSTVRVLIARKSPTISRPESSMLTEPHSSQPQQAPSASWHSLTRASLPALPPIRSALIDSPSSHDATTTFASLNNIPSARPGIPETHGIMRIGYIRVMAFNEHATLALRGQLSEWGQLKVPPVGVVLDVRNNLGGVFQEAMQVAGLFINDEDANVVTTLDGNGIVKAHLVRDQRCNGRLENTVGAVGGDDGARRKTQALLYETPVVVLANGGSASSSEVLAVALRENGRGLIVGTQTFGKGLIQHIFPLPDGGALKLTVGEYLSPRLSHIHGRGAVPDILCTAPPAPVSQNTNQDALDSCVTTATRVITQLHRNQPQ
mmetsp:Transcript_12382/g.27048  ORF Transcript_12382/g.27048 Transcript_12382/m.27048 type:complete len:653 (+) Transcript_12382:20-1978(+)